MSARILVVDDDPVQRRLLEAMLKRFDYEPVVTDGAEAALKLLDSADGVDIECIVLDLVMPDLDGQERDRRPCRDHGREHAATVDDQDFLR